MKNTLNEIKSLMLRMEDTPNGGSNFINEVSCKWRMVVGEDDFYDLLSGLKQGNRVTFGYISQAKIVVPKGKKLNPTTNRMNQFDDYETLGKNLGEEGKLINVIKLSIYNIPWQKQGPENGKYPEGSEKYFDETKPWQKQDSVSEKYAAWKNLRDTIGNGVGATFGTKKYNTVSNNFGNNGGISQYAGQNQELTAHTYTHLNMYNIKPISTTYHLVFEDGTIKEIDIKKLELLPYKSSQTTIEKLKAAGAKEEDIAQLEGMEYKNFEHSHVLFVSATPDTGIPTLLINNKLSDKIGGIAHTSQDAIINLARERYNKFCNTEF